jgi:hypothetical protein
MSDVRRSRQRAILAVIAVLSLFGAAVGACTNYQRSNGEGCLKDVDCLTNYCVAQVCATPPTPVDGSAYGEAGEDAGTPGKGDAAPPGDTGTPGDSATGG